MTLGLASVVVRPLHEIVEIWLRTARLPTAPGMDRVEPCGCGGVITARNQVGAIEHAVRWHAETARHSRWAIANGWRDG